MTVMDSPEPYVRWLIGRDMPDVLEIERHSFEEPWTQNEMIDCIQQRNCIGMVAEIDRVVGYVIFEMFKDRFKIKRLAVHRDFRRFGVARAIIQKLKFKLPQNQRHLIHVLINERNLIAQKAFRQMGFVAVEVQVDSYLMVFDLNETPQPKFSKTKRISI